MKARTAYLLDGERGAGAGAERGGADEDGFACYRQTRFRLQYDTERIEKPTSRGTTSTPQLFSLFNSVREIENISLVNSNRQTDKTLDLGAKWFV